MMRAKSILKSNSGFSLLEMIIVIAIISIMTGISVLAFSVVDNANVSKAANSFDTAFNSARVESMARGREAGKLILTYTGGTLYYQIGATGTPKEICNSMITVSAVVGENYALQTGVPLADGAVIEYEFNSAGSVVYTDASTMVTKLIFTRGRRNVEVFLYLDTGKHDTNMFYTP